MCLISCSAGICPRHKFLIPRPIFPKFEPTLCQLFLIMYLIWVQVCPKSNFLLSQSIPFPPNLKTILPTPRAFQKCNIFRAKYVPSPTFLYFNRFPSNSNLSYLLQVGFEIIRTGPHFFCFSTDFIQILHCLSLLYF